MYYFLQHKYWMTAYMVGLLLLTSCTSNNKVSQDFKPGTDFKSLKTFAWHNFSSEIPNSDNTAIQHNVEQILIQKGFQPVTTNADFVLDMNVITQQSSGSSTGLGVSIGLPIGNSGSIGLGTGKLLGGNDNREGLIILDVTQQKTNQIIWRGNAESIPLSHFLLRNERQLNADLKKLIDQFPPQ